jgi:phage protein D
MTEVPVAVAGPVFRVDDELVGDLARDCVGLQVHEGVDGLRTCELTLLGAGAGATGPPDGTLLHVDSGTVDLGRALRVAVGPADNQRYVFDGTVSGIELVLDDGSPPVVVVLAEDTLMRLRMTRRARTWNQVSDADLASSIASEHGMQADVSAPGPTYDVVQQLNQSDLAFLRERGRLVQAELWCSGRTLHFRTRPMRSATDITLVRGAELLSVRLCADLSDQRSTVTVTGYDAQDKGVIDERAEADVVEGETSGGRCGARLVEQALGTAATLRVREAALTSEEAQAWARAEMLRRGRAFVRVSGTTIGTPDLMVGSRLTLQQVGEPFEGEGYYVTSIRHSFDLTRGLRTWFTAERATLNEVSR